MIAIANPSPIRVVVRWLDGSRSRIAPELIPIPLSDWLKICLRENCSSFKVPMALGSRDARRKIGREMLFLRGIVRSQLDSIRSALVHSIHSDRIIAYHVRTSSGKLKESRMRNANRMCVVHACSPRLGSLHIQMHVSCEHTLDLFRNARRRHIFQLACRRRLGLNALRMTLS